VRISRKEAFGFALARRLLSAFEGTPLHLEMRAMLGKIAESLEGEISVEPEWLSEQVSVLAEDRVEVDPGVWAQVVGFLERREVFQADSTAFISRIMESRMSGQAPNSGKASGSNKALIVTKSNWRRKVIGTGVCENGAPSSIPIRHVIRPVVYRPGAAPGGESASSRLNGD
jgi:hypothetical protein